MQCLMVEALELRIREATEDDLPAMEWEGEFIRFRRVYQDAMKEAKKGKRVILVAEAGDALIGQIFVNLHSTWRTSSFGQRTGYLHSFRVKPEFRNQGVGRRLILQAESDLKARGYRRAVISVAKTNHDALRLYRTLGYVAFREDPGRWSFLDHQNQVQHITEPAYILHKTL
jgi:ribosomal protein S18 acetylase RimI-like enzyme